MNLLERLFLSKKKKNVSIPFSEWNLTFPENNIEGTIASELNINNNNSDHSSLSDFGGGGASGSWDSNSDSSNIFDSGSSDSGSSSCD